MIKSEVEDKIKKLKHNFKLGWSTTDVIFALNLLLETILKYNK